MTLPEKIERIDHAMTVTEISDLLNLGKTAIYEMTRRGAIPFYRLGGSVRFDPDAIAEWLRTHSIQGPLSRRRK